MRKQTQEELKIYKLQFLKSYSLIATGLIIIILSFVFLFRYFPLNVPVGMFGGIFFGCGLASLYGDIVCKNIREGKY